VCASERRRRAACARSAALVFVELRPEINAAVPCDSWGPNSTLPRRAAVLKERRAARQLDMARTAEYVLVALQWGALESRLLAFARRRTGAAAGPDGAPLGGWAGAAGGQQQKSRLGGGVAARRKGIGAGVSRRETSGEPQSRNQHCVHCIASGGPFRGAGGFLEACVRDAFKHFWMLQGESVSVAIQAHAKLNSRIP
jgi:hypothetical protein